MSKIVVLGSFMMDLLAKTHRLPNDGETLIGDNFEKNAGGKGANQAATIAKLEEDVTFIGMVGRDEFGIEAKSALSNAGVNTEFLLTTNKSATGVGCVWVDRYGTNRIIVIPGANLEFSIDDFEKVKTIIIKAELLVLQLEMDLFLTKKVIEFAYVNGIKVLLNPAPAVPLEKSVLQKVNYLTPNETELEILTKRKIDTKEDIIKAARSLIELGVENIIVTLGEKGALWMDSNFQIIERSAFRVKPVDTVAAGDSFNGALAYGLVNNMEKEAILKLANTVGAFTVTKSGAIKSLPDKKELATLEQILV
ncbi:ribokinase [Enterococcus faecium]|uniref:ribokinase n=1 Tax=Enterococcus faecium TaxID=1352 RepID=UPI00032DF393|nr:ribokinase [Enterococcus faecium]EOG03989.1 ribokinase [Enterococcus faecium EnGen0171]EOK12285.1 ribokinase [Enterococcus faecium EnGen0372]EOM39455.1 ribokinase [Enterococcus faecium EnGen0172]MDG4589030.1 ribokinase [Enterococcus faecium]MDT2317499.1 ribokinase [Enterococcus faecium]